MFAVERNGFHCLPMLSARERAPHDYAGHLRATRLSVLVSCSPARPHDGDCNAGGDGAQVLGVAFCVVLRLLIEQLALLFKRLFK